MKIFNWVHRRFKDGSTAQNANRNGVVPDEINDAKDEILADKTAFGDSAFGCWKGGILTIGTFGYDPLAKEYDDDDQYQEFHVNDHREEFESAENYHENNIADSEEEELESNPLVYERDCEALLQQYDPPEDYIKMNEWDVDMKKERITLADLFSADHWDDSDVEKKQSKKKLEDLMKEKGSSSRNVRGRLSFAKTLLLAKDSKDARPIHKLHRLVRRMLKRKIHPELGHLKEVSESDVINCSPKVNESAPLLPIDQDGH